jgi:hypothetical protein
VEAGSVLPKCKGKISARISMLVRSFCYVEKYIKFEVWVLSFKDLTKMENNF